MLLCHAPGKKNWCMYCPLIGGKIQWALMPKPLSYLICTNFLQCSGAENELLNGAIGYKFALYLVKI